MPALRPLGIVGFLAGPTASGKSAAAIAIARRRGLAVISADSMQVYRGMAIGTAQPSAAEQEGVPHRLMAVADPADQFDAARFVSEARQAAQEELALGRRSLVVGGTGMWIEALRHGLFEGPGRDPALRERLAQQIAAEGTAALHAGLAAVDPAAAARIPPSDPARIVRAIEVFELTGKPISAWQAEDAARRAAEPPDTPLVVLDAGADLDKRIALRVDAMMAAGWLAEARALRGLAPHLPAAKALGYPQLFAVLDGRLELGAAVEEIKLRTRQFARRQRTWFRGRRDAHWATRDQAESALRLD